jgi:hypothetical protein
VLTGDVPAFALGDEVSPPAPLPPVPPPDALGFGVSMLPSVPSERLSEPHAAARTLTVARARVLAATNRGLKKR